MGGNAFAQSLPDCAFPRLPPHVYHKLKARLIVRVQALFAHVAVPTEAPEKVDFGDIDFVVASAEPGTPPAPPADVRDALDATHMVPMPGYRISHYSIPLSSEDWDACAEGNRFCQVDVHVCEDRSDWERVVFMHSYGDLGMIMGSIMRRNNFHLSTKGLKLPNPPNPSIHLSDSLPDILSFMGLSLDVWKAGFTTQQAVFDWLSTSRFLRTCTPFTRSEDDPPEGARTRRVMAERKMYAAFVRWAIQRENESGQDQPRGNGVKLALREEALIRFGKKDAYEAAESSLRVRRTVKASFNGSLVAEWTGLDGRWYEVKRIMDAVREKLGGEPGVARLAEQEGQDGFRKAVEEVVMELGLNVERKLPNEETR